jgi:uncharacterized damage-inducible protein DinB
MSRRGLFLQNLDLLARYNSAFNDRLHAVLRSTEFNRAALFGQINHLLAMDGIWLFRLGTASSMAQSALTRYSAPVGTLDQWWDSRQQLDAGLTEFVHGLDRHDLDDTIEFVTEAENADVCCKRWAALTHLFNHQTLHRGEMIRLLNIDRIQFGNSDLLPHIVELLPAMRPIAALATDDHRPR